MHGEPILWSYLPDLVNKPDMIVTLGLHPLEQANHHGHVYAIDERWHARHRGSILGRGFFFGAELAESRPGPFAWMRTT